jgi:GPH family glycoside/pentoside/hexuronide:cation symporter
MIPKNSILATHSSPKLSFRTKVAYALGGLGNAVGPGTIIPFWYTFFLTDVARLDLGLVSLFWIVVTTWDALNDPLVGYLSDRTRSRWGRRRPYLLLGALPFGLFFVLLWWIPPTHNQLLLFFYYLAAYVFFETTATAVTCPYAAMLPELTRDHDERTSLVMYQMVVTILAGVLVPVLFGLVVLPMFPSRDPRAYQVLALVCGACFSVTSLITFFGAHEGLEFQRQGALSLRETARSILRNVPFRYALAIHVLGWMPVTIVMALFAYYFIYWIGLDTVTVSLVQGGIMLMAWLFLPVVLWLSRRYEKRTAYSIAAGSWAVLMLATLLLPQGARIPAYILCALSGFGIAAIHLMPSAMLPDVIEVDELASGHRQEGAYVGVTNFAGKLGQMATLAMLPVILRRAGYIQPGAENALAGQPASALQALRLMIAILPALFLGTSLIVAHFYPLTRERHAQIRRELAGRTPLKRDG